MRSARIDPRAVAMITDPDLDRWLFAPRLSVQPQQGATQVVEFPYLALTVGLTVAYLRRMPSIAQHHIAALAYVAIPLHCDWTGAWVA